LENKIKVFFSLRGDTISPMVKNKFTKEPNTDFHITAKFMIASHRMPIFAKSVPAFCKSPPGRKSQSAAAALKGVQRAVSARAATAAKGSNAESIYAMLYLDTS
jgi:hypothetical protein